MILFGLFQSIVNTESSRFRGMAGQWVELLHSQHLWLVCFVSMPPCAWRWLTLRRLFELDLKEVVVRMHDFISTDIHSMRPFSEADFLSCSRSLDHAFLSSVHIFCSIIDNIWLWWAKLNNVLCYCVWHEAWISINTVQVVPVPSILRAANLGEWSSQWVELLHGQHLWLVCFVLSISWGTLTSLSVL